MTPLLNDLLHLGIGIGCAWGGGELFVRGLVGLSRWARIPAGLAGVTVAAFATSSPEVAVGVKSALEGMPQISLGDVTGSNVANVALILALALVLAPMKASLKESGRDFLMALAVPGVIAMLAWDGFLSRGDGIFMLGLFLLWLIAVICEALKKRTTEASEPVPVAKMVGLSLLGLGLLIGAGHFIVVGAKGLALAAGLSEFVVGATIVAVATSTPELATTIVARLRGHDDIGLGNVLGSNVFNGLFIIPIVAMISPFGLQLSSVSLALAAGVITTLMCLPIKGVIGRGRGVLLLLAYIAYVALLLKSGQSH